MSAHDTTPGWTGRLFAYKQVEEWAHDLTHQQETNWGEAFTDADAEALADYFESVNGIDDTLFLFRECPADADLKVWAEYLSTLREAVERLESKIATPPCTDEAWPVRNWAKGVLTEYEAALGRANIARLTSEVTQ